MTDDNKNFTEIVSTVEVPSSLKIGEILEFQRQSGIDIRKETDSFVTTLFAVWVAMRRKNPQTTWADVCDLEIQVGTNSDTDSPDDADS